MTSRRALTFLFLAGSAAAPAAPPQDPPHRLRVYLDQLSPPAVARDALDAAAASGLPFEAVVVVRDFAALDRDLLAWRPADLSSLRLADRPDLDALARAAAPGAGTAPRLPCFVLDARHRACGVPRDFQEMIRCSKR